MADVVVKFLFVFVSVIVVVSLYFQMSKEFSFRCGSCHLGFL